MSHKELNLKLKVWRQKNAQTAGAFKTYELNGISDEMSFLEMLDVLNEKLITEGGEPVAFDHDCREGICGMCSLYIDGKPHGPWQANTTCQLHMRAFNDGDTITIEPWRANSFPIVKDLTVDRSAFDRIIQAGGYVSVNTGTAVDGERKSRVLNMVAQMDKEGFGSCTNTGACEAACPKEISIANIARLNKEYIGASLTSE